MDSTTRECRVCRGTEEPLYRPCLCSGSIGYVHTQCLVEWLDHSGRNSCEVCKTHYKFETAYSVDKPNTTATIIGAAIKCGRAVPYVTVRLLSCVVWLLASGGGGSLCWGFFYGYTDDNNVGSQSQSNNTGGMGVGMDGGKGFNGPFTLEKVKSHLSPYITSLSPLLLPGVLLSIFSVVSLLSIITLYDNVRRVRDGEEGRGEGERIRIAVGDVEVPHNGAIDNLRIDGNANDDINPQPPNPPQPHNQEGREGEGGGEAIQPPP
eukprot:CAMPEP_0118657572 /NCGR_PEP_ID=MMETSP0785-20121206/14094_1 /TAXON_ID=91992 /ORGANISM="Bolidomonas pacifica, Strain CCMP 1866" /LENGTH=263 /DNA_ID=CAMNT_0006550507 /DNA_START=208 /DNA_END=995 /DNA_ORIENTATION=+